MVPSFKRGPIDSRNNQVKNFRNPYENKAGAYPGQRGTEAPFSENVVQSEIFNNEHEV